MFVLAFNSQDPAKEEIHYLAKLSFALSRFASLAFIARKTVT